MDVRDAMGANRLNTAAELLRPRLEELGGGRALMAILSNEARDRIAGARCAIPFGDLQRLVPPGMSGEEAARRIAAASAVAQEDPSRAVTHNKGIMNGISSLALATMNDTRAVEAAAHAWAARSGRYAGLSTWTAAGGLLVGDLEMPLPLATAGGSVGFHPAARASLRILGFPDSPRLCRIAAAVGLAQNFAALLALVTYGIQKGHMRYNAARLAWRAGARGGEVRRLADALSRTELARDGCRVHDGCPRRRGGARSPVPAEGTGAVSGETVCRAGPSLALIKYWGKSVKGDNLPATPSLAVTLGGVHTETQAVVTTEPDSMSVDGVVQDPARYAFFFDTLRHTLGITARFRASSVNSFPTSAGLASSSSGFAALAGACARAAGCEPSPAGPLRHRPGRVRLGRPLSVRRLRSPAGRCAPCTPGLRTRALAGPPHRGGGHPPRAQACPVPPGNGGDARKLAVLLLLDQGIRGAAPGGPAGAGDARPAAAGGNRAAQLQPHARGHPRGAATAPVLAACNGGGDPRVRGDEGSGHRRLGNHRRGPPGEDPLSFRRRGCHCRAHGRTGQRHPDHRLPARTGAAVRPRARESTGYRGAVSAARLTVPGNILVLGEYAVLEEGGLGFAVAVETRVRLETEPAPTLSIQGTWPGSSVSWTPGQPRNERARGDRGGRRIAAAGWSDHGETACRFLRVFHLGRQEDRARLQRRGQRRPRVRPASSGRRRCVALGGGTRSWHWRRTGAPRAAGAAGTMSSRRSTAARASSAAVLPRRGIHAPIPGAMDILLFPGPAPVSTADSVKRYSLWKERNPGSARDFLAESNSAILSFVRVGHHQRRAEGTREVQDAGDRARQVDRRDGRPAHPRGPGSFLVQGPRGGERARALPRTARRRAASLPCPEARPVLRAETGVTWEE